MGTWLLVHTHSHSFSMQFTTDRQTESATAPFNGPFSGAIWVSRYQKGKTSLDFTKARDSEWKWHQLGHMQGCTSLQTDNHTRTPPLFFTGQMPFLPPNQQRQSTEGTVTMQLTTSVVFRYCNCAMANNFWWATLHSLYVGLPDDHV